MSKIQNYHDYITDFFALLDKYLINDLETLITEIPSRDEGGAGYPTLQTILAGMELLGLILSGETMNPAFKFYWENYLCKLFTKYNDINLFNIFRHVIRNGTAHFFLVKKGITVSKNNNNHLTTYKFNGKVCLNIDLIILHDHFKHTYIKIKNDLLNMPLLTPIICKGFDNFQAQMDEADKLVQEFLNVEISNGSSVITLGTDLKISSVPYFVTPSGTEVQSNQS